MHIGIGGLKSPGVFFYEKEADGKLIREFNSTPNLLAALWVMTDSLANLSYAFATVNIFSVQVHSA